MSAYAARGASVAGGVSVLVLSVAVVMSSPRLSWSSGGRRPGEPNLICRSRRRKNEPLTPRPVFGPGAAGDPPRMVTRVATEEGDQPALATLHRTPSYRRAAVILLLAMLLASLFVISYIDGLGRPTARALHIAAVGLPPEQSTFARALQQQTAKGIRYDSYPSAAAAEAAVARQEIYAVLVLAPDRPALLELSSASGSSVSRVLTQAAAAAHGASGTDVQLRDLHPLPPQDPSGLAEFYLTLAATIVGFVATSQLRATARPLPLRAWLGFTGTLAVGGSFVLTAIATGLLDVPVPFWHSWLLVGMQMSVASAFAATMAVVVGRWALLPTWLLFVVLGNTSSGGAVSAPLLPEPLRTLGRVLPSGATVSALR